MLGKSIDEGFEFLGHCFLLQPARLERNGQLDCQTIGNYVCGFNNKFIISFLIYSCARRSFIGLFLKRSNCIVDLLHCRR